MPLATSNGRRAGRGLGPLLCLVLSLSGGPLLRAQEADPPDPQPPTQAQAQSYTPMTDAERWHDYLHDNFTGVGPVVGFFSAAAIGQLGRDPHEWGLGAQGYWHRVGNHMGRAAIRGSIEAGLAAALHYDTRYHRLPGDKGLHRARHALRRTFFTRNEDGKTVLDVPNLAGIYGADMLSTYWRPHRFTPFGSGVRAANFGLAFQTAGNLGKEFGPDLKRLILHK